MQRVSSALSSALRRGSAAALLILLPAAAGARPLVDGRSYRLSARPEIIPSADVLDADTSPDEQWIVYIASDGDDNNTVYSVPSDGSGPRRTLSQDTGQAFIADLTVSPDGSRVLYLAANRLFSVPIDGSAAPLDLVGPHVTGFRVTPDSARVVMIADLFTADRFLLWSMPIDGGPALEESGPVTAGGDVFQVLLTPDGTRAIYRADALSNGVYELFSAPLGPASGAVRLNSQMAVGGVEPTWRLTPDGTRVVWLANAVTSTTVDLFSAPVDGSTSAVMLDEHPTTGQDVQTDFVVSPDGTHVVFRQGPYSGAYRLRAADVEGLAPPVTLAGTDDVSSGPLVSADGLRVLYRADAITDGVQELFSVPIDDSSPPVRLNGALSAGESVQPGFALTPLGARVVFSAGTTGANVLFAAPVDGSAAPLVIDSDPSTSKTGAKFAGNVRAVYRKTDTDGTTLWSARLDASSAPVALSSGSAVNVYELVAAGAAVLYTSDDDEWTVLELFACNTNGAGDSVQISPEFTPDYQAGRVSAFQVAGDLAVYSASRDMSEFESLYSVPITGHRASISISGGPGLPIDVQSTSATLAIGSGPRAVFLGERTGTVELFSAPVDGSVPPTALSGPMTAGGAVASFVLSADGATVAYLADQVVDDVFELFSVAIDGSSGPTKLNGTLVPGGDVVAGFLPRADGARVVYVADQVTDEKFELFSSDGLASVKLSGVMIAAGDVQADPLLSADGAWVFYRADPTVDGRIELFRVPSDGSASSLALSGSMVAGGQVQAGFRVTPDASRVVFIADREQDHWLALYSAPADASAAPLRLNSSGDVNHDVYSVLLDPAGTRAVFHFSVPSHNAELYSIPIDGSAPQILLTPMSNNGRVFGLDEGVPPGIQISADGARVVYRANPDAFDKAELFSVQLDGSAPPIKLNGPLGRDVRSFRIDASGQRVAYATLDIRAAIHEVPIAREREPFRLNPTLPPNHSVQHDYAFAPGSLLLYRFDPTQLGRPELWVGLLERLPRRRPPTLR